MARESETTGLAFYPLTPQRWDDFARLFGPRGACGGCWCMWWRLSAKEFGRGKGAGNRRAMKRIVEGGTVPGILAYRGSEPVGWCSIAPRGDFPRLERSKVMAPFDERPVWSLVCLFVARRQRRRGVSDALVKAAVRYARRRGGRIVEACPVDTGGRRIADAFAFHGLTETFTKAGFVEVARRSPSRPLMRRYAGRSGDGSGA